MHQFEKFYILNDNILCRYDYVLSREYNWNVKNKASKGYEETYFFVMRDGGVFYNELETRSVKVVVEYCKADVLYFALFFLFNFD